MNNLKFRAWHKDKKIMVEVSRMYFYKTILKAVSVCSLNPRGLYSHSILTAEELEIMQSTGLTDKNGKEIYEGDIIQDDDEGFRYIVEYVSSSFMLKGKNGKYEMSELFPSDAVIGNIYESPELLNS